jgi:hypothetical protein
VSRERFFYRPQHPRANERGFVSEADLGADLPTVDGHVAIVGDTHHDGVRAPDEFKTDISTKKKRREYMRANNLGDFEDFKGARERAAKERAELSTTGGDHKERREQVERAIYDLETGRVKANRAKVSAREREAMSRQAAEIARRGR